MALRARLRERREALLAQAEHDRGNRVINPNGWSYKIYRRWEKRYSPYRSSEDLNFCNYWRAVLLWASARFVQRKIMAIPFAPIIAVVILLAVLGLIVWSFVWHTAVTLIVIGVIFAVLLAVLSIYLGITIFRWGIRDVELWHLPGEHDFYPKRLKVVYYVVFGLPAIAIALVVAILVGLLWVLIFLFQDLGIHEIIGHGIAVGVKSTVKTLNVSNRRVPWLRPWMGFIPLAAGVYIQYGVSSLGWIFLWTVLAAIPLGFALIFVLTIVFNKIINVVERRDLETLTRLFSTPGFMEWYWAEEENQYDGRYNRKFLALTHKSTAADFARVFDWDRAIDILDDYLRSHPQFRTEDMPRSLRPVKPSQPRRARLRRTKVVLNGVGRFLAGLWELIAILWSGFLYIEKVGACPKYTVGKPAETQQPNE